MVRNNHEFTGVLDGTLCKLCLGDKVVLLNRFQGKIVFECGAYGIAFDECIDWDFIKSQIEPITGCDDIPMFCENDTFISLWELLWNFGEEQNICRVVKKL